MIRAALAFLALAATLALEGDAIAQLSSRPYRIYAITFRGMTDVEKGFQDYFTARRIPVQITFRDLNRDPSRMPGFIEEIRRTKPDLVYTWGTSVTLGVVGTYDGVDPQQHITDIPVVFTLVAAPVLAKIVRDMKNPGRNVTGVFFVAHRTRSARWLPTVRSSRWASSIRPRADSVVVVEEVREVSSAWASQWWPNHPSSTQQEVTAERAGNGARRNSRQRRVALPAAGSCLGTIAQKVVIPAAVRGDAGIRLDGQRWKRGAHRPREPLPLDRPVHRVQGRTDPREQVRPRRSPWRHSRASRCRFAWTWPGAETPAAAADVQLRGADRPEARGPHPGHAGRRRRSKPGSVPGLPHQTPSSSPTISQVSSDFDLKRSTVAHGALEHIPSL
jgi:putative ABC transport system substrate-binding protein